MTIRAVLVLAATLAACSTVKTHQPSRVGKGLLVLEHGSTRESFPDGYCWSSSASPAAGGQAVFAESGCIHGGGKRWGEYVPVGDYMVEYRRCAGETCWSERAELPLVCHAQVTVSEGMLVKLIDRWDAHGTCSVEVRRQPLDGVYPGR